MRRIGMFSAALALALVAGMSFNAMASWQGTFYYYENGALVGKLTGGCGAADGFSGRKTDDWKFVQGCQSES